MVEGTERRISSMRVAHVQSMLKHFNSRLLFSHLYDHVKYRCCSASRARRLRFFVAIPLSG